jgi:hypothetical protein
MLWWPSETTCHESIAVKDHGADIKGLLGALCAHVVARNVIIASGIEEAPNLGAPTDNAWELTWTKVVKQLKRARCVDGS